MRKIKITKVPSGSSSTGFNQIAPNAVPDKMNEKPIEVNSTMKPVPKHQANVEAEKGEFVYLGNEQGAPATFVVGGKRHSEGGTPLDLPEQAFMFSDTRSMKLKDKELLSEFGETKSKTYADIAKKYNINKYREILANPDSDEIQRETAEQMIQNYNAKLGKLALVQESQKGFPTGIPSISVPYMETNGIDPDMILPVAPPQTGFSGYMQKAGEVRKDTFDYNDQFTKAYLEALQEYMPELPVTYTPGSVEKDKWSRPSLQHKSGSGLYGDSEVQDYYSDWEKRHKWYLKDHPDFDPSDKEDVADFQKAYNKKASEYGLPAYFASTNNKGTSVDGLFGEHTWSAPGLNPRELKEAKAAAEKTKGVENKITPRELEIEPTYNPFGFYPQDTLNLMTGMAQQIPDMDTFYAPLQFKGIDPAYITEDYRPIMESVNQSVRGMESFAPRQAGIASMLKASGEGMRAADEHNQKVAMANIGIYNDAQKFNSQVMNENAKFNSMLKTADFDARELYEADRVKAKNAKRAELARLFNTRLTNATDTYNLNLTSPHYKIDPTMGGMAYFHKGMPLKPNKSGMMSPRYQEYSALREEGYNHDEAIDIIGRQTSKTPGYRDLSQDYYNPYDFPTGPYGF